MVRVRGRRPGVLCVVVRAARRQLGVGHRVQWGSRHLVDADGERQPQGVRDRAVDGDDPGDRGDPAHHQQRLDGAQPHRRRARDQERRRGARWVEGRARRCAGSRQLHAAVRDRRPCRQRHEGDADGHRRRRRNRRHRHRCAAGDTDDDDVAGDGQDDGRRRCQVPGEDGRARWRRTGAGDPRRRHQGVRPHRRDRQVGGRARQVRRRLDVQRSRPGPGDPRVRRRQGAHRPPERPARVDLAAPPRHPGAELDGRRRPVHAAGDRTRQELHLRVHRQGTGRRDLPLAPRRPDPGAQRSVRCVPDRRDADPPEADRRGLHAGRQAREHGAQRCRHDRAEPQRQELPRHRAVHAAGRPGHGGQLPQRGTALAPDAPPPAHRMDHRQGRRAARRADARRHDQHRPR